MNEFDDIHDPFEFDYLHTQIHTEALRRKYQLSRKKFQELCTLIKKENNLERRPMPHKYYSIQGNWIKIIRKFNGKTQYYGCIHISQRNQLHHALYLCEKIGWDKPRECREAINNLKKEKLVKEIRI